MTFATALRLIPGLLLAALAAPAAAEDTPLLGGELVRADQAAWSRAGGNPSSGGAWFLSVTAERAWSTRAIAVRVDAQDGAGVGPRPGGCTWAAFASGEPGVAVQEVLLSQTAFDGGLDLVAGWLDLTSAFDANAAANSETEQFLACSLVNSPLVDFPDPAPSFSAWVNARSALRAGGAFLADREAGRDGRFAILELQGLYRTGTARGYLWSRRAPDGAASSGIGCSLDRQAGSDATLFLRAARRVEPGAPASSSVSAGAEVAVRFAPAAFGVAMERIVHAHGGNGARLHADLHAELYARVEIAPGLSVTPDLQWGRERGEDGTVRDVIVAGLRTRVAF